MKYIYYQNWHGIDPNETKFVKLGEKTKARLLQENFITEADQLTFIPTSGDSRIEWFGD